MARIKTYGLDSDINAADKVVGTDGTPGSDLGKTKNFSVSALRSFIGSGGNLITKKITVTTDQLKTIHTGPVTLIDIADNEVADVISVIIKTSNQTAQNKLTFPDPLTIEPAISNSTSYNYPIAAASLNNTSNIIYKPIVAAGGTDPGPIVGDVRFKSTSSSNAPTETGTATTEVTIWITYQIIDLTDI
jgi:hypothetical protein